MKDKKRLPGGGAGHARVPGVPPFGKYVTRIFFRAYQEALDFLVRGRTGPRGTPSGILARGSHVDSLRRLSFPATSCQERPLGVGCGI